MRKRRILYAIIFITLLCVELVIALFVHDAFVRPYIGDVLVTVLLCCLCRIAVPKGVPALPAYVFLFAALVEAAQYIDVVKLLGWEDNAILSTLIGRTFSWADILCYGVGCVAFWAAEKRVIFRWKERQKER
jgi:hypothetical protein